MPSKIIRMVVKEYNAQKEKDSNIVGKRIAEARHLHRYSLAAMEGVLREHGVDVTRASINKWENGETTPNAYQLLALIHALQIDDVIAYFSYAYDPQLNEEGQRKVREYTRDLIASGLYSPSDPDADEIVDFPWAYLAVSAGSGQCLDSDSFSTTGVKKSEIPNGADYCLTVSGDSMEPVFHSGDLVFVKQCEVLDIGDVGIFIYGGDGYIKVFNEKLITGSDPSMSGVGESYRQPVMISYNCKYDPIEVNLQLGFKIAGKVIGSIRK